MRLGISKYPLWIIALLAGGTVGLAQTQSTSPTQTQTTPGAQTPSTPTAQTPSTPTAQAPGAGGQAGVQVNPSNVQKKAGTPPPSSATKTGSIGKSSATKMSTPANSDSWIETIDVDGDGSAEQSNLVWDSKDKMLFSDSEGTFTCRSGATGAGELLIGVNAEGNPRGRPAGSGFWVASVDKGTCGAQAPGLWGCKFDASGNPTTCGVATIDQQNGDIVVVTASPR